MCLCVSEKTSVYYVSMFLQLGSKTVKPLNIKFCACEHITRPRLHRSDPILLYYEIVWNVEGDHKGEGIELKLNIHWLTCLTVLICSILCIWSPSAHMKGCLSYWWHSQAKRMHIARYTYPESVYTINILTMHTERWLSIRVRKAKTLTLALTYLIWPSR